MSFDMSWKTFALDLKSQVCLNKLTKKKWSVHEVRMRFFTPNKSSQVGVVKWSSPFSPSLLDLFVSETAVVFLVGGKGSLH